MSSVLRLVNQTGGAATWPELIAEIQKWAARNVLPRHVFDQLSDELKAQTFTAVRLWDQNALQAALASLSRAMAEGISVREWRERDWDRIASAYGRQGARESWYLDTVFRTNTQAAYAGGRYAEMFRADRIRFVPYVLFNAVGDSRTRPEHLALDGKVFRKDDWTARRYFPPLGYNCRCSLIELDDEERQAGGHSVTPGSAISVLPTPGGGVIGPPPTGWDTDRVLALSPGALASLPAPAAPPQPTPTPKPKPRSGPSGTPIAPHFDLPAIKAHADEFKRALALIDSIHGDGTLKQASVRYARGDAGHYLSGGWNGRTKKPWNEIKVGKDAKHRLVQAAHEIGHKLDLEGLGAGLRFASESLPEFAGVLQAIRATPEFQALMALPAGGRRAYLTSARELWARAYSQYVAVESGDQDMLDQIELWRTGRLNREKAGQWSDKSFGPIRVEITKLLKLKGWRA